MTIYEEQLRQANSRRAALLGALLWVFALVSGFVPAVAAGVIGFLSIDFLLDSFFDLPTDYQYGTNIGFRSILGLVVFGYPLALLLADRVGPWMIGATKLDSENPNHVELFRSMRLMSLAAGVAPILFVVEGDWVNGASLGKRGKRPVVVVSEGTAHAPKEVRELVMASVLAESLGGSGASRVWLATRAPALWPLAIGRWFRYRRGILGVLAGLYVSAALTQFGAGGLVFAGLIMPICFAMAGSVVLLWLAGLSSASRLLAKASHSNADLGAMALLRHPEGWAKAFGWVAASASRPSLFAGLAMEWVLPTDERTARKRAAALMEQLPAMQHSVARPTNYQQAA